MCREHLVVSPFLLLGTGVELLPSRVCQAGFLLGHLFREGQDRRRRRVFDRRSLPQENAGGSVRRGGKFELCAVFIGPS